jgi:hypothetical protein
MSVNMEQLELIRKIRAMMQIDDLHQVSEATTKASILMAVYTLTDDGMNEIPIREISLRILRDAPLKVDHSVIHTNVVTHIGKLVSEGLLKRINDDVYESTIDGLESGAAFKIFVDQYRALLGGPVAQRLEQRPHKSLALGSNPSGSTIS